MCSKHQSLSRFKKCFDNLHKRKTLCSKWVTWTFWYSGKLFSPFCCLTCSTAAELSRLPLVSTGDADMLFRIESQCFPNLDQALTGHSFSVQLGGISSWSIWCIHEDFTWLGFDYDQIVWTWLEGTVRWMGRLRCYALDWVLTLRVHPVNAALFKSLLPRLKR